MRNARLRRYQPPTDAETLRRLYWDLGLSKEKIGRLFGASEKVIQTAMRRLGVPSDSARRRDQRGSLNHNWKGDEAGYQAMHLRVASVRGTPTCCDLCETDDASRTYDWANVSGDYGDPSDYVRACRSCHRRIDSSSYPRDAAGRFRSVAR